MGNVQERPFASTWKLNNRSVVKYTPDALVFINGDTSLPGCARCRGRIEIQKFVTGISVEAGTSPTSHSATINLALPRVQGQQVFIDGYNILRVGLEVHVFMRGYFPIRGMFSHLPDPQGGSDEGGAPPTNSSRLDLSKYATYPYYPVFHGLITQVSYEYSDGFYYGTLNCTSLLHFWQFVNMTTSGAWLGQDKKPTNDPSRPTLYGHNFNNTHPFSIMYTLYRDVAGAAAGVDFSLAGESNVDAVAAGTGEDGRQIYDMVSIYWEQRFKTRIQSFRMYGVNGQLFNAAQQAWLGKSRDIEGLLPSATAADSTTTSTVLDPFATRYSVAKALGLQGAGLDFTFSPLIQQDGDLFNLSVLDMFAFNQQMGEIGNANLWQSTYQTKMDIAQRVMEVTGFEFYQDVDGDLVFKPPFWNLDTAPNRYYRLEDSDIINITFTEKEPNATYILVRGIWIAGIEGVTPTKDSLDKRGMYVDYKLVAKFGWRPAPALELTYVTDPKVLFWIGVGRLDMLNVDTFSASATIPIRAELRPGFPVYIPFVDSYYYITQLSHSFSFGGRCTTSLVLTCRRSKWHAPGFLKPASLGDSAIDLIRLDRPDLPPRPLEIIVNDVPRIVGFPNVVMALDPRKINPNFSVVGVGIEYFNSVDAPADMLYNLIVRDIHLLGAFSINSTAPGVDGKQYIEDPTLVTSLKLDRGNNIPPIVFTVDSLIKAFIALRESNIDYNDARQKVLDAEEARVQSDQGYKTFELAARQGQAVSDPSASAIEAYTEVDQAQAYLQHELVKRANVIESEPIRDLVLILEALQPESNKPIRRKIDGIPGSDVQFAYFETLSHLKGQYMASSVPGYYRYFSCSHPSEEQQGMPIIRWSDGQRDKRSSQRVPRGRSRGKIRPSENTVVQELLPNIFDTLTAALSQIPKVATWLRGEGEVDVLFGLFGKREEAAKENMDPVIAQRLMDITSVANTIVQRVLASPQYQDAVTKSNGVVLRNPQLHSGYRPVAEPASTEAFHSAGVAIDIIWISQSAGEMETAGGDAAVVLWQQAVDVVRIEVARAYQEGLVQGIGFYNTNGAGGTFTHIDRRGDPDAQKEILDRNQETREAYLQGNVDAPIQKPNEKKGTYERRRRNFFKDIGLADPNIKPPGHNKSAAPSPDDRATWVENDSTWPDFVRLDRIKGEGLNFGWAPFNPPVNKVQIGGTAPANTSPQPSNDTPAQSVPDLGAVYRPPSIDTQDLSLEVPRTVVQFKKTVSSSGENRRAPEVELGVGKCVKGIPIALGPNRTPQVITTDQIQRISFVRHQAGKFSQVVGTSQSSGNVSLRAQSLIKRVTDVFMVATQDLDDPSQTISDLFESIYQQMKDDLASVPIPVYENGQKVEDTKISLLEFPDVLVVDADLVPPAVRKQLKETFGDEDQYLLAGFTIQQLSLIEGYTTPGAPQGNGQNWQRGPEAAASNYARSVVEQIERGNNLEGIAEGDLATDKWVGFLELQRAALPDDKGGTTDQKIRQDAISQAIKEATDKAFGPGQALDPVVANTSETKVVDEGIINKPIHSPVFPVSDEKGYEHYGAYRYGRGLSVEPGGNWEFLHSGKDPFQNVTPQNVEEFLRVFTLVNSGRIPELETALTNFHEALAGVTGHVLNAKQEALDNYTRVQDDAEAFRLSGESQSQVDQTFSKVEISDQEQVQIEQSVMSLAQVVSTMKQTSRGKDALREVLRANGDNPDLLDTPSWSITDTQFLRNFVNFAVNFGKSPVFKTTAANAAYRLADLTTHLLDRAGPSCICRGALADISLEAYSQDTFLTVEGVDPATQKAEAYAGEENIKASPGHIVQQQRDRGAEFQDLEDTASTFQNGRTTGAGMSGNLPSPFEDEEEDEDIVSAENPPTTVNLADLPSPEVEEEETPLPDVEG